MNESSLVTTVDGTELELLYGHEMVKQAGSKPYRTFDVQAVYIYGGEEITDWINDEYYGKFVKLCEKHFKES
jgi:hypothetical protein